ncbi:putative flippase GtrA [Anaerotaenia torta]|uniref:GtrA family protein n=1 Tax=Anaerotaenia torta TaxID=433293 RepID=UPI003D242F48
MLREEPQEKQRQAAGRRSSIQWRWRNLVGKVVNRETITYIITGVLTTIVNFISYESLYRLGAGNLTANACAWVIAVTFAYIVNKKKVFLSVSENAADEVTKLSKFYGARLITLGVEQLGMFLFVEKLGFYRLLVKASLAVIVIVLNYLCSKLYIFKKN